MSEAQLREAERLPAPLRLLLDAELAAGNKIVEVSSTHPAPPAGVYFLLANPVSTMPRASDGEIHFYLRNTSQYSGEFHDERRFFFILEAPLPPPPEPDMNAIRARMNAQQGVPPTPAERIVRDYGLSDSNGNVLSEQELVARAKSPALGSALKRFVDSMVIDYSKWHDGIGYDLDALREATHEERASIELILVTRSPRDWRDVEALSLLQTERARESLRESMASGDAELRAAVVRHAPEVVPDEERIASLVRGLREGTFYHGLSEMIDEAAAFHPEVVVDEIFRQALHGSGDKAVHMAALLFHIHGITGETFDWAHRPFFLRFNTDEPGERRAAFDELCARIGADPARYR